MTTQFIRVEISYIMEISSDKLPELAQLDDSEQIWANDDLRETLIN
ncbi:hypothetical protein [Laspinema olomoucense]|nr:hypothetical protein [Laspinema sp. D3d]MCT7971272.1 hypothetical protein [Laspinema sp. D3d]